MKGNFMAALAWTTAVQSTVPQSNQVTAVQQLVQIIITDAAVLSPFDSFLALRLLQQCQQFLWTYRQQISLEAAF